MSDLAYNLEQIQAMLAKPRPDGSAVDPITGQLTRGHIDWLIAEVERLRKALEQIADDGVEGYESPQKRVALEALRSQG